MRRKNVLSCVLLFFSFFCSAQSAFYLITFTDKPHAEESITQPETFLTPASLERRNEQSVEVDEYDVPVYAPYITEVKEEGVVVAGQTKWLNGVVGQLGDASVDELLAKDFVHDIQLLKGQPGGQQKVSKITSKVTDWEEQFQMLGIKEMHSMHFTGEGVTIAVMDGGFSGVNVLGGFSHLDIDDHYDFVNDTTAVFDETDHGTSVLSLLAWKTASQTGAVPDARYFLFQTEDIHSESPLEEMNWIFAAERADSLGVDLINSSLGYYEFDNELLDYSYQDMDGSTTLVSRGANIAVSRGISVITSAGNTGNSAWKYIVSPADAADVLTVGAINRNGDAASFSAYGPSADGRIKPDLTAIGSNAVVVNENGNMVYVNGTSFSAPLVTGLVAGLRQKMPDMNVYELNDTIRHTAERDGDPDFRTGYGVPNFSDIVNPKPQKHPDGNDLNVVPNPLSKGQLTLQLRFEIIPQDVDISVFNATAQQVFKGSGVVEDAFIKTGFNVEEWPPGVYVVVVASEDKVWRVRFRKI